MQKNTFFLQTNSNLVETLPKSKVSLYLNGQGQGIHQGRDT